MKAECSEGGEIGELDIANSGSRRLLRWVRRSAIALETCGFSNEATSNRCQTKPAAASWMVQVSRQFTGALGA